mmetsp:Transcript_18623/g.28013  ORF Transcript_18623/g.28013 Transcript_18623/m.28013 type:complete len:276 (+) Transcript_18623:79-906(+)|eukprot:CAMPEP_0206473140 /NCGR_PEP_ID=MMETSP0324_2-20121206/32661_1 /ASSEMBLY_ACC=CAM_ASM_000836 /TAXON_ID=2866 /ORGANISM="Crypthecodinium cohnii, Strain Seligo" /LENGTH=275 /DNA_ID=CAMNT_0053947959 /DNA_START=70 /DNA_END=897 /DNA_ORIENTATION=-
MPLSSSSYSCFLRRSSVVVLTVAAAIWSVSANRLVEEAFLELEEHAAAQLVPESGKCGELEFSSVGKKLGQGMEGVAYKADVAGKTVVLKVASPKHEKSLKSECEKAQGMKLAGVTGILECLASCAPPETDFTMAVLSPLVNKPQEFGLSIVDLGDKTASAFKRVVEIAAEMLSAGYINVDQANNILFDGDTGMPTFIDFGRARKLTKKGGFKEKYQVNTMLHDLLVTIVPEDLRCSVFSQAETAFASLQDSPAAKFVAPLVSEAMKGMKDKKSC